MKQKIIQVCLSLFLGITSFQAQQQGVRIEESEEVVSTKFGRRKATNIIVDNTRAFKFDVVKMMRGELNFSLEKKATNRLSLEYGLGITISEVDYLSDFHLYGGSGMKTNSNVGFLASFSTRYYPLEEFDVFNRFYVSPMLKFTNFNTNYVYENGDLILSKRGLQNKGSFTFNFGMQSWLSKTFALDFYIGLGLGFSNKTSYSYDYNGIDLVWNETKRTGANYIFTTGVKVAIGK
jgi:hypothetical protein